MSLELVHDSTKFPTEAAINLVGYCAVLIDCAEDPVSEKFATSVLHFFWKRCEHKEVKEAAALVLLNHLADLYLEELE